MVKPVRMTMQEILSMWLDVGHKLQKHPPDGDKEVVPKTERSSDPYANTYLLSRSNTAIYRRVQNEG